MISIVMVEKVVFKRHKISLSITWYMEVVIIGQALHSSRVDGDTVDRPDSKCGV